MDDEYVIAGHLNYKGDQTRGAIGIVMGPLHGTRDTLATVVEAAYDKEKDMTKLTLAYGVHAEVIINGKRQSS